MLTLYYGPGACSMASHIVLEESGEKYEPKRMDLAKGEQRSESYLKMNPLGRVPLLQLDNGDPLAEDFSFCGNDVVAELVDVVVAELRRVRHEPLGGEELRRAKDHLKGSLMLNLESTSSRMSHHARQEIYRDRADSLDEMLAAIERVSIADVQRLARQFFAGDSLAATVLGDVNGLQLTREQLRLD